MESAPKTSPDVLKSEHLKAGIKPIIACIGSRDDIGIDLDVLRAADTENNNVHNVDYYKSSESVKAKKFLGGGQTWTISTVDNLNKFSNEFYNCTGLVVVGKDKVTGQNISFLSHQDPTMFLKSLKKVFIKDMKKRLVEIKNKCEAGTIDAVVVGGQYPLNQPHSQFEDTPPQRRQEYVNSVNFLSSGVKQVLDFEPIVINGPKTGMSHDDVYFDNENRRLYFMRPNTNSKTGGFTNSNLKEERKNWHGHM
jgi:hypothetical protein